MFVDIAKVSIKAGDGGNGYVSFRQEKFVDKGGPDGGDGGKGGDVIFVASNNENTLANFRFNHEIKAEEGSKGFKQKQHGKSAENTIIKVPVGTQVVREDGELLADLAIDGDRALIARGGKGGFGNAHFASSTRQVPQVAERGERGEIVECTLELKIIADVGLVGLPNAGKSTLLSVISNARPEIANYPFTTLKPNLGMVTLGDTSFLVADIPGLIEGASEGKGLGDEFLRHVERTYLLVHLIDIYNDDVVEAYKTIQQELKAYRADLTKRPQIIALTKIEGVMPELIEEAKKSIQKVAPRGTPVLTLSAQTRQGLPELLQVVAEYVSKERAQKIADELESPTVPILGVEPDVRTWSIERDDKTWIITGHKIEKFAERTHFGDYYGEQRLRDIMRKMKITQKLEKSGIDAGDKIQFGKPKIGTMDY